MKTTIYYFSATGNSLKVARDITYKLGDTSIISITNSKKNVEIDFSAEQIGIVFPVYMWGIPKIIEKFIESLDIRNVPKYIFAIATCKSQPGGALNQLNKKLMSRGIKLSAGFNVYMPGNNISYYKADSIDMQNDKFRTWENRIDEIVKSIKSRTVCKIESGSLLTCVLGTTFLHGLLIKTFSKADKQFWTDEKCEGCSTCTKVCPVNNIKMVADKPVWQNKCEQCAACINLCPKQSIQFRKATINRKRYRNPFVELKDLMNK